MGIKEKFEFELVVVENFLEHVKGEVITDFKKIEEYLESEFQNHFVKKAVTVEVAPVVTDKAV